MADFTIIDHSGEVLRALEENVEAALEACGNQAVSHAKQNINSVPRVDTGALMQSISHVTWAEGGELYVGTNQSYAIYNEMGTGIYIGGGRRSPWAFKDGKGEWHMTRGMKGIHFLKNAMANHVEEYKAIITKYLKK